MRRKSLKIFIIKIGGEIIDTPNALQSFCQEIAELRKKNNKIIIVHGGGQTATAWEEKLGRPAKIIQGKRITDEITLDIVKMIFSGKINIELLSLLQTCGVSAVGLSGVDGNILTVQRRPPQKIIDNKTGKTKKIDYGFVGDIVTVNPKLLTILIKKNFVPVIAPLAADKNGIIYNINADRVAAAIAHSLSPCQWIIATNVDGVYDAQSRIFSRLSCAESLSLIKQGIITDGMIPKIESIISALKSKIKPGVKSVRIINGMQAGKLSELILQTKSIGTLISN